MKTTLTFLTVAAAISLTSCDQAKDAAAEATAKAKAAATEATAKAQAAAAEAKTKAEGAMPDLKAKATAAMEAAKEAGAGALDKTKELADAAGDWTKQKLGIPEADGMLEGFHALFAEAKTAVSNGMTGEKATALKAKWDDLYAKSSESIKNLAPEQQEKVKSILAAIKAKWDELMEKSKDGAVQ